MKTATRVVHEAIKSEIVGNVSTIVSRLKSQGFSVSLRHANRVIDEVFATTRLTSFGQVRAADGSPLNNLVFPALDALLRKKRLKVLFGQFATIDGQSFLLLSDRRGAVTWSAIHSSTPESAKSGLLRIADFIGENFLLIPHRQLHALLAGVSLDHRITVVDYSHRPLPYVPRSYSPSRSGVEHTHLNQLEAESVRIIREAVAVGAKPAMLFSLGKDSAVMWTLAKKAFQPDRPPFPLVFVDTRWEHQELYRFKEYVENEWDADFISYTNPTAVQDNINPFDHGSALHTEITKTIALKQVLDKREFDFVFGGGRRSEERSRAKERIFSIRNGRHEWDPKNQRPELWNLYNTTLVRGQSMRVFPLSNWTELDVWRYIERENIAVAPLYFSKIRPFVERDGALIMVDDERFRLDEDEVISFEPIRFRTLGCYPLTGGVRSNASTVAEVILELENSRVSERSSRIIDFDIGASMEQKKKDGYF